MGKHEETKDSSSRIERYPLNDVLRNKYHHKIHIRAVSLFLRLNEGVRSSCFVNSMESEKLVLWTLSSHMPCRS